MYKISFEDMNCSIARSLDQIGEWWSLLIVRECTLGTTRFDEFQRRLGIARNVLTNRLAHLIEQGILEKLPIENSKRFFEYRLTQKGEELYPVLVALLQWGDRWIETERGPPLKLVENRTGKPVDPMAIRSDDSDALSFHDIRLLPGPGATADTHVMIENRNKVILKEAPAAGSQ